MMATPPEPPNPENRLRQAARLLDPLHQHSAFSAAVLLSTTVLLSRVIGYLREAYIAYAFGAGTETDAYVAAFTLPDWLNYLVAGGTASITFLSIFTRYVSAGREEEAKKAFHVILTVMTAVLVAGIGVVAVFAPQLVGLLFPRFTREQHELCVWLTRILLPAQLFFYVGGVVSAVLMSRRQFLYPALAPLLYNVGIIAGGILLGAKLGVASLAIGAVAGSFAGPFLVNAIGAHKGGVRYRVSWDVNHPAFREWIWLSIPLMLGVTLVTADDWILRYFASGSAGDITRLNYAKRLFAVPVAVLAQAAGQASLPFFARLFGEGRKTEFAATVSRSVYRVASLALLASAWMMAAALPLVDLVYRRGRFQFSDSETTAAYFLWFALSLGLWAAQALYARGFYAAGDTMTPMAAGTLVTVASLPVYAWLFDSMGVVGLAMASGLGILGHTVVLAGLLHRKGLVPLGTLPWKELAKAAVTAVAAGAAGVAVARTVELDGSRAADVASLALVTVTWAAAVAAGLWLTRSELPGMLKRTRGSR